MVKMATSAKLNGWWRLWIFAVLLWTLGVCVYGHLSWPSETQAEHHPAFIYQLAATQRDLLVFDEGSATGTIVRMPNGYLLRFKPGVDETAGIPVASAYHEISVRAQAEANRKRLSQLTWVALLPSIALGLIGIGIAWVRQGFETPSKRGASLEAKPTHKTQNFTASDGQTESSQASTNSMGCDGAKNPS